MIKYNDTMVVFRELPDEIALAINLTNCPFRCAGCHSPELREDIGKNLTENVIKTFASTPGITAICLMGGDASPEEVAKLGHLIKALGLKSGWYSGRDTLKGIDKLAFDYIKIGHYDKTKGGLDHKETNQKLYKVQKKDDGILMEDITSKFWRN